MYDGIFIISNALVIRGAVSIYSTEERLQQTLETIASIDKHVPNNLKIMFDASPDRPDEDLFQEIAKRNVKICYSGDSPDVNYASTLGAKSVGETISTLMILEWLKLQDIATRRIYKISGRYTLNDNFVPGLQHIGKYVFTVPTKTWMSEERIRATGVDHVYQSRLYHFDSSLLNQAAEEMQQVIKDCVTLGIDVEHALYKNFKKYDPVEMVKIGLCGNQAPSGEYVDD